MIADEYVGMGKDIFGRIIVVEKLSKWYPWDGYT